MKKLIISLLLACCISAMAEENFYDFSTKDNSYAEGWATNGTLTLTTQNVFYPWTNWVTSNYSSDICWTNNGIYICDSSADGLYRIVGQLSVTMNSNIETLHAHLFLSDDGGPTNIVTSIGNEAYMQSSGKVYPVSVSGLIRLDCDDYLEVGFANGDSGGKVVTCTHINFNMTKVSD